MASRRSWSQRQGFAQAVALCSQSIWSLCRARNNNLSKQPSTASTAAHVQVAECRQDEHSSSRSKSWNCSRHPQGSIRWHRCRFGGCHDCERRYGWSFYSRRFNIFCLISHTDDDGDILYECWTCMHRIFEHNILCHLNCDVALQCKSIRQRKTSQL